MKAAESELCLQQLMHQIIHCTTLVGNRTFHRKNTNNKNTIGVIDRQTSHARVNWSADAAETDLPITH